ncbi:hypothetical protein DFP72DRAFT_369317 [Ephemerocybe angulata]|uniref:DUF6533 domain-containing protein n=1 Tax=Ephemerocybe angulata TaxID=980116 RepID=A0A8H6HWV4_9AGAR|nr:hypothetical protein DFP72DRAFT_369317 [Tulosesus angulatus]
MLLDFKDSILSGNVASELNGGVAHKYIITIASTIIYYDYFLTLPREVAWVWLSKPRVTFINTLFFLNRYVTFLAHIGFLMQAFWLPSENSSRLKKPRDLNDSNCRCRCSTRHRNLDRILRGEVPDSRRCSFSTSWL